MTVCTSDFFVVLLCGESCSTFIVLRLHSTLACLGVHTLLQPVGSLSAGSGPAL